MKKIFELRNIQMSYNGSPVLRSISLSVERGTFLSIVGPNGAGKSTILRLMAGLIKADKGDIVFSGTSIRDIPLKNLAKKVGYLPQVNQPVFPYNCFDYVMIGRTPYLKGLMLGSDSDRDIVRKAMEDTDCLKFASKDLDKISVGERQCVFVARALAAEPEVLLLDEPAASLDLEHSVSLYRLLVKLMDRKGIAIVVVSHNLNITSQFADRIIMLNKGEIVADGPPAKVLNQKLLAKVYGNSFRLISDSDLQRPIIVPNR